MESSNKLSRVAKRDKHQRFSIRKFNVGVASVAIAAFWMISGNAVAADTLDVTPETAGDATVLVESATEESADAEEEPASPEAEVAPEVIAEAPVAEEVAEVEEAPVAEEVVEAEVAEEDATEEAEVKSAEPSETKSEAPAAEKVAETPAAVQATRVAATTYRVRYVNEETGAIEFQRNYSVNETTENAVDEPHTFNVSVNLEVPEGFVAVSANNAAGQDLAIVNNAIAAAVVEKDSSSRALFVTVRKDDVTANNNDKEGYTALRATTNPSTTPTTNIESPEKAESVDYAVSGAWEYSNPLPYEKDEKNVVSRQTEYQNIYSTATAVVPRENSTPVTVTVTVSDLENQTAENANRIQIQQANENQSSYGGTSEHFELMDDPSAVPTLDIRVRANRLTADQNPDEKFNFSGEYDSGYITIEFSEPVINPIIDLSGLGGNVMGTGRDNPNDPSTAFVRGSFNSTVWEYLGDEALELSAGAENLQINGNRVEVINRNTTARVQESPSRIGTTSVNLGNFGTSAGTGSVKVVGTVTSLTFKLIHQATPVSEFAYLDGANTELILRNDGLGGTDGINGLDRDANDDGHYYTYQSDGASGMLANINADLFRFSLRLPTGYVVVNYVDTEGNELQPQYTDTAKGTAEATEYDTAEDTTEKPEEIVANGETYYLVPAGDYPVGTVGENNELTATDTELGTDEVAGETILGKKEVTYVYQKGGDVQVHYYTEDGTPLSGTTTGIDKAEVTEDEEDTAKTKPGTEYDTTDLRPDTITDADGKVWELVEEKTDGYSEKGGEIDETFPGETGEVASDTTKHINYYYKESKGDVKVNYFAVDADGNVIEFPEGAPLAESVEDTPMSSNGTEYDTTDYKPATITGPDGKVYELVADLTDGDDEAGTVEAGKTKEVNYYYREITTDVNVHYHAVDKDGNVLEDVALKASEKVLEDAAQGEDYDTTSEDLKPKEIKTEDGATYRLVSEKGTNPHEETDGDAETGQTEVVVDEETGEVDKTKDVHYYYERVTGDVVVNYYAVDEEGNVVGFEDGEPLKASVKDEDAQDIEKTYDTTDNSPEYITRDTVDETTGQPETRVYKRVDLGKKGAAEDERNPHAYTDGDPETGEVIEGTKEVNYYYEHITGNVIVKYFAVDENGEVITFEDGSKLAEDALDTVEGEIDDEYDTTDLKPDTIVKGDATYRRVDLPREDGTKNPHAETDGDDETGTIEEGPDKVVNYYYERVTGDVEVHYHIVDAEGNVLVTDAIDKVDVATDENINQPYSTLEQKAPFITVGDKVYVLVEELTDGDAEEGDVEEGTKVVNYYYVEQPANVNVHYHVVDDEGNVVEDIDLKDSEEVLKGAAQGTDYDTTTEELKPAVIEGKDGKVYQRVDVDGTNPHEATDGDAEKGSAEVTVNEDGTLDDTKDVNYYYEAVKANVNVHYYAVDEAGNKLDIELKDSEKVLEDAAQGTDYDTIKEHKPEVIEGKDGKVYQRVDVKGTNPHAATDGDDEQGKATVTVNEDGTIDDTKDVNYYYEEVPTNVVVNYIAVDDKGNVLEIKIADQAKDTVDAAQGTDYNTAEDLKPTTIVDENGDVWQLVSVKGTNPHAETDGDDEVGTTSVTVNEDGTLNDTKVVNYYYEKVKANVNVHYFILNDDDEIEDRLGGISTGIDKDEVKETEADTVAGEQGDDYDTSDLYPHRIVKDGVTYERTGKTDGDEPAGKLTVEVDEEGNVDDTKDVNYYYKRISGNVQVHYHIVDKDGNVLTEEAIAPEYAAYDAEIAETYSTEAQKKDYIVVDGKIYDLVTEETSAHDVTDGDAEEGKISKGTKHVNYYYVERPTNVNVHYYAVDKDGNVITDENGEPVKLQDSVEDTKDAAQGEDYDTTDNKPDTIVKDGVTYKRVDINGTNPHAATDGDDETGVTEATVDEDGNIDDTKDVNYYYERISGNVNVHYYAVDENGNVVEFADGEPLKASVVDTEDENIDVDYTTTDNRPDTIVRDTVDDTTGEPETRLYKRVDINGTNPHAYTDGDDEDGKVAEGDKDVNYYYEHIIGNVHVRYYAVDENGNVIEFEDGSKLAEDVLDTVEGEIGEAYDTTEHKPDTIVKDGVTYKRVDLPREDGKVNPHAATDGDPEAADVTEKDRVVNYYYEKVTGDVIVHYVDTEGNVIAEEVVDTEKANIGEEYNTDEDNKPDTITFNDEVYYLTAKESSEDSASTTGEVVEGTTHVTYVYEKGGDVVVNYIAVDKDGNPLDIKIKEQARDTAEFTKPGTAYDTSDLKEQIIVDEDGNTWRLVSLAGTNPHAETDGADENGEVKAGETLEVNYYYELVTGDVVVSYVDEDGNQIAKNEVDTPKETPTGKDYNTDEDLKPESITTADGTVYYLTEKETSDRSANPIGSVVEGTTYVEYVYAKAGSVVVNYYPVDAEGNQILDENGEPVVLQAQVEDTTNAKAGTEYDTTDLKPEEITDAEGRTWRLVSVAGTNPHAATDGDDETGAVASGETKEINYYYELVTGDVVVHYVDTEGNVIAEDAVDTEKGTATGTEYNTDEDLKPETITTADGTVYYLTAKETSEDSAPTTGEVVEGTTEITYVYEKAGHVEVHYHIVDEKGNVITTDAIDFVKDTENGKPGSEFDTTDHKPAEITVGDKTYVLVADLTKDAETGSVVAGETQVVNYYYVEKVEEPVEEPGSVEVHYHIVDENGNVITTDAIDFVVDTKDGNAGDAYDTTDHKPSEITVDGVTYVLVEELTDGDETGSVEAGTTKVVNYHYVVKPVTPTEEPTETPTEEPTEVPTETPTEEPTEVPTETPTEEPTEVPTETPTEAPTEEPTVQPGSVEVHYHIVDKDGNVITADAIDFVVDTKDGKSGDAYDTTDHKPSEITVNGVTYVLVADLTKDAETGSVEAGTTKKVNYYYVVKETTPVVPEEPVAPSKPVAVGEELSEEDKTKVIDSIDLPEGSTAEVTTPVQVDEQGQPHVEVEVTDNAGEKSTVKVPVEAVTVLAPAASTATPVTVGSELTEENAQIIIGRITLPTGTTAEVTSPVKINNDGVAVVEVTVTDEAGNTTVVEVAVDAVVSPTEAVSPTTPVVVGDVLTPANAEAVIGSVKVPEGSTAEVTSPVQVDDNGNAYVEVTVTDAAGNTIVVKAPVEVATEPTTVWVTEDGKVLQARQDGNFAHADFDGYEFVRTEVDADGNITHIFRPAGGSFAAEPTTVWVTEDGKVLRPSEDGNFAHAEFDGYEFVRTEIDADGNITHIFRPAGGSFAAEQPTTIWITEDGKVLRPREDGSLDKSAFDGYEFVRTVVDADGHITHIFRPVAKTGETGTEGIGTTPRRSAQATGAKYVTKDTAQLPNTGEESNVATATGLGLLMSVLGLAGLRRRKED